MVPVTVSYISLRPISLLLGCAVKKKVRARADRVKKPHPNHRSGEYFPGLDWMDRVTGCARIP